MAFQFVVAETFTDAPVNLISWIGDLLVTEQGGRRILYSVSRAGGGVVAFDIGAGMTIVDQVVSSVGTALTAPPTLDLVTFGGRTRLVMSGIPQTSLLTYQIDPADPIGRIVRPIGGPAGVISAQELLTAGAQTWLYAAATNSAAVNAYAMAADGTLTLIQTLALAPAQQGVNVAGLLQFQAGGAQFLAAVLPGEDSVALMRVSATGTLSAPEVIGAAQGLGINGPAALGVQVAHGATYLLVAAGASSSFSVIEVAADGTMTVRDHLVDTLATRFQGVLAFDSFSLGGRSFVVLGGGDGGLELLEILPGGRLIRLAQILDTAATAMDGVSAITATVLGTQVEIFVAGEGTGITRLVLDLSQLGQVLAGGAGQDSLTGGTGNDLLVGGAGNDVLAGSQGDDVLVDGAGADTLSGGAGRDLFVLVMDGQTDRITDFQVGIDRLDLSAWGRIYSLAVVKIVSTVGGAQLVYQGEVLEIYSSNGMPLTRTQLLAAGAFDLWHVTSPLHGPDGELMGTDQSDYLEGTDGADLVMASGGNDTINGLGGGDMLDFSGVTVAVRADLLTGIALLGIGARTEFSSIEHLVGAAFNDTLQGDAGDNLISGGAGNDLLIGRGGNDTLVGGAGEDTLQGDEGNDVYWGQAGADTFIYTSGADIIADFQPGMDLIRIDDAVLGDDRHTLPDLLANAIENTANNIVYLDFGGGNRLTILGISDADMLAEYIAIF